MADAAGEPVGRLKIREIDPEEVKCRADKDLSGNVRRLELDLVTQCHEDVWLKVTLDLSKSTGFLLSHELTCSDVKVNNEEVEDGHYFDNVDNHPQEIGIANFIVRVKRDQLKVSHKGENQASITVNVVKISFLSQHSDYVKDGNKFLHPQKDNGSPVPSMGVDTESWRGNITEEMKWPCNFKISVKGQLKFASGEPGGIPDFKGIRLLGPPVYTVNLTHTRRYVRTYTKACECCSGKCSKMQKILKKREERKPASSNNTANSSSNRKTASKWSKGSSTKNKLFTPSVTNNSTDREFPFPIRSGGSDRTAAAYGFPIMPSPSPSCQVVGQQADEYQMSAAVNQTFPPYNHRPGICNSMYMNNGRSYDYSGSSHAPRTTAPLLYSGDPLCYDVNFRQPPAETGSQMSYVSHEFSSHHFKPTSSLPSYTTAVKLPQLLMQQSQPQQHPKTQPSQLQQEVKAEQQQQEDDRWRNNGPVTSPVISSMEDESLYSRYPRLDSSYTTSYGSSVNQRDPKALNPTPSSEFFTSQPDSAVSFDISNNQPEYQTL